MAAPAKPRGSPSGRARPGAAPPRRGRRAPFPLEQARHLHMVRLGGTGPRVARAPGGSPVLLEAGRIAAPRWRGWRHARTATRAGAASAMLSATPSARPARGGSTTERVEPAQLRAARAPRRRPPPRCPRGSCRRCGAGRAPTSPAASMAMTSAPALASGTENVPPPAYRSATSSPSRPSGPSSPIRPPRPSTTSAASFSACAVFTWKNDGALVRERASASSSPQQPLPSRVSTLLDLARAPGVGQHAHDAAWP